MVVLKDRLLTDSVLLQVSERDARVTECGASFANANYGYSKKATCESGARRAAARARCSCVVYRRWSGVGAAQDECKSIQNGKGGK